MIITKARLERTNVSTADSLKWSWMKHSIILIGTVSGNAGNNPENQENSVDVVLDVISNGPDLN